MEGLRWWYDTETTHEAVPSLTWPNLLSRWDAIETDFHHFYHCDLATGVLRDRSWRWFRIRLIRLLADETQLARAIKMPHTQPKQPAPQQ